MTSAAPVFLMANPGQHTLLPGQTPEGGYILSVLLKRSYDIVTDGICTRAHEDGALLGGDEFWDSPMNSSVRIESDFVPFKLATDVVLNGTAFAPGGKPVSECIASLSVAGASKRVRVVGDRVAHFVEDGVPRFSDPIPFESMALKYENAYGGVDVYSDSAVAYAYPRNPVGKGFVVKNCQAAVDNLALPNVEDMDHALSPETLCIADYAAWDRQPAPAGFGWIRKTWLPRAALAGTMPADRAVEQQLRAEYAKFVPADKRDAYLKNRIPEMNFQFFNGATNGLSVPFLQGGEQIITENLCPDGIVAFLLPVDRPIIKVDIGGGLQAPDVVMHTVMIHMDERKLDLVWRAAIPYSGPDWLPQMKRLDIQVEEGMS